VLGVGILAGSVALVTDQGSGEIIDEVSPGVIVQASRPFLGGEERRHPSEHRTRIVEPPRQPDREPTAARRVVTIRCPKSQPSWLVAHQDEDGRWDADGFWKHDGSQACAGVGAARADVACTSAVVLAMLGDGSTMRSGPNREPVMKAVRWLIRRQQPGGFFVTEAGILEPRDHSLVTYALCEAMGLSKYKSLRKYAQRALDHLGTLRSYSTDRDWVLFLGWQIHAYVSGRSFGLEVPEGAARQALEELVALRGRVRGLAQAVELTCRFMMGQDPGGEPVMRRLADEIRSTTPEWGAGFDVDRCFFATYAMYQLGGDHWKQWSGSLNTAVVKTQRSEAGPEKGSWDPIGFAGPRGGRVYATAMMVLTLEAYYRYTRLVR
jgi:hypothetical protein